jgi:Fe-Mn family superoxide dismutase
VWTPGEGLKIVNTSGAGCPLTTPGAVPLLTMDVWEHAYYLDYQNLRDSYCRTFVDYLVDWKVVASRLPQQA